MLHTYVINKLACLTIAKTFPTLYNICEKCWSAPECSSLPRLYRGGKMFSSQTHQLISAQKYLQHWSQLSFGAPTNLAFQNFFHRRSSRSRSLDLIKFQEAEDQIWSQSLLFSPRRWRRTIISQSVRTFVQSYV